jgi:hypothetical protein
LDTNAANAREQLVFFKNTNPMNIWDAAEYDAALTDSDVT